MYNLHKADPPGRHGSCLISRAIAIEKARDLERGVFNGHSCIMMQIMLIKDRRGHGKVSGHNPVSNIDLQVSHSGDTRDVRHRK